MIFQTLLEAIERNELMLVEGGFCHWHLCKNGQITIYEIIVLPEYRNKGIAIRILEQLKNARGATNIFAKCPADLEANKWYENRGFICEGKETLKSGKVLNLLRYRIENNNLLF